ncbi:Ribosomal protein S16, partial [Dillenia turbinata]
MVVRIRLSRFGCKNKPFYRVMAADSRSPRDGKHLEVLGYYNPVPGQDGGKRMGLNFDSVKYWLSVGAQPSEPVQRILFRAGLLPPPPMMAMGRKGGPCDTRPIDPMTGRFLTQRNRSILRNKMILTLIKMTMWNVNPWHESLTAK